MENTVSIASVTKTEAEAIASRVKAAGIRASVEPNNLDRFLSSDYAKVNCTHSVIVARTDAAAAHRAGGSGCWL